MFYKVIFTILLLCTLANGQELPRVILDTAVQSSGVIRPAASSSDFQAAINAASGGDVIVLTAGLTYTGNFTLPNKAGAAWITIRSSAENELPPTGTRVGPANAPKMPKIITPNAEPAIRTLPGAHHYRFVGVEITTTSTFTYDLVRLGDSAQTTLAATPTDFIFDRCYVHGTAANNLRRGIALNSARTAVIDSHISDCHEIGQDSQALCGWNGPGPFKIVNNYLEGAAENVMFGGADPKIPGLVPSDIEFRRNHCFKPLSWKVGHASYAGKHWSVKNIFELKNARRVLVDGNTFENNWVDGQNGTAILFTVRNQEGTAPWSVVEDVTFTNNILKGTAAAINILGKDYNNPSQQTKRIKIANNLFHDIGGAAWGGNGVFLTITDALDVVVDHNTVVHRGNLITAYGVPSQNFIFINNLSPHNEYGVIGDSKGTGLSTITTYFPNGVFKRNALAGGLARLYPADNFFPPTLDIQADFKLAPTSPLRGSGSDGKDVGVDVGALGGTSPAPVPVPPTPPPTPPVETDWEKFDRLWLEITELVRRLKRG